ncbi:hypothetical protein ANN_12199 [Periplaneta americana]|uniref:Uncharacterized protein n=1 Tax=Periplaneta americana TaxID=6978 RepID=A0ABQ8TI15_PERAM|nr:hypothetical protein ANN_12199 [Periplaneta americana]
MAGLCEGGNEPPGSLKPVSPWHTTTADTSSYLGDGGIVFVVNKAKVMRFFPGFLSTQYEQMLVDGIGDSEMVFGEMSWRIRHRLPDICLTVGENLGKNPTRIQIRKQEETEEGETHRCSVHLGFLYDKNCEMILG